MSTEVKRNVLLTSVGHQVQLAAAFGRAFDGLGMVVGADADRWAPALTVADVALTPPAWTADTYPSWIKAVVAEREIGLVVPLHEGELAILETIREELFKVGALLTGSPHVPVGVLTDKYLVAKMLQAMEIPCPKTYLARDVIEGAQTLDGPVVLKPRTGRASRGVRFLDGIGAIQDMVPSRELDRFVVQPKLQGDEFGMDVVNDLHGRFRGALIRKKLRMRHGETDRAEAIRHPDLEELARKISAFTRHIGLFDTDVFVDSNGPLLLDINPRFGGGYLFNHVAGADVPAAFAAWLSGDEERDSLLDYREGSTAQRIAYVMPAGAMATAG